MQPNLWSNADAADEPSCRWINGWVHKTRRWGPWVVGLRCLVRTRDAWCSCVAGKTFATNRNISKVRKTTRGIISLLHSWAYGVTAANGASWLLFVITHKMTPVVEFQHLFSPFWDIKPQRQVMIDQLQLQDILKSTKLNDHTSYLQACHSYRIAQLNLFYSPV